MVLIAKVQADQLQASGHFHGYPKDFFHSRWTVADRFYEPLSRITKPLDR